MSLKAKRVAAKPLEHQSPSFILAVRKRRRPAREKCKAHLSSLELPLDEGTVILVIIREEEGGSRRRKEMGISHLIIQSIGRERILHFSS